MNTSFKYFLAVVVVFGNSFCANKKNSLNNQLSEKSDSSFSSTDENNESKSKKILEGARQNLKEGSKYDVTMGYYVLKYKDGQYTESEVYPGGDIDPKIGVCTDVVIRSLRNAGIVDLQEVLYEDISRNGKDYSLSSADRNIDHRRVTNLEVWFSKNWNKGDKINFAPGDIVIWDMNRDGKSEHIGIVTDKREGERYFVIHNHPDPGQIAEEDKLYKWKITGHYRIKE